MDKDIAEGLVKWLSGVNRKLERQRLMTNRLLDKNTAQDKVIKLLQGQIRAQAMQINRLLKEEQRKCVNLQENNM